MEGLAQQLADVINQADPASRHDLREYATDLLRGGTEMADLAPAARRPGAQATNPIGIAILLGAMSIPLMLIFAPLGLMMAVVAVVLGVVGVGMTIFRR